MRNVLAFIGAIAILAAIVAAGYFFGGYYNVAAANRRGDVFDRALVRVRDASISRHATASPPTSLDDPQIVEAGARAFAKHDCDDCHGGPGVNRKPFGRAMNPGPPGLRTLSAIDPRAMFWVIKNGIRMTAMPSFGRLGVGDHNIWQVVAFIKNVATVSADQYKAWTAPAAPPTPAGQSAPPG